MDELIKTFHIEINLLVAQMVNFIIVLLVLYKFAYKPVLKTLNDRTRKIEKGLKDSKEASEKLEEITLQEKEVLTVAKKEAQEIIKKSREDAIRISADILDQAKEQNKKMIEDAKENIDQEKTKMLSEVRAEIANLVIAATEKIIYEKLDSQKDKEIIEKAML